MGAGEFVADVRRERVAGFVFVCHIETHFICEDC